MRIYNDKNVYNTALDRIRFLFDEFPEVVIGVSGGKDSTVVFNLAKIIAREKGRLPLKVMWLDQECEWDATVDMVKSIMYDPDVKPYWYQIPFRLQNATSSENLWLNVWGEGEKWIREKDPISIKENIYGVDRFHQMFGAIINKEFAGKKACYLAGVRAEESPARAMTLTGQATYKWLTWGKVLDKKQDHYTFYPVYDWSYIDIWKAIHDNNWEYNRLYDEMYRYGVKTQDMRVSNFHHETAVWSLFIMQEIEPDTYQRATQRISGIDTAGKMGREDYFIKELPFMFKDWIEYRDYLLDNLITRPEIKSSLANHFTYMDKRYAADVGDPLYRTQIQSILTNDIELTKLKNWEKSLTAMIIKRKQKGRVTW